MLNDGRPSTPEQADVVHRDVKPSNVIAAPIVKWVGGKAKLLPELLKRTPRTYGRYYEPFAGGAALFFKLAPERAVIGDANADLIAMYRAVVDDVEAVIECLRGHIELHSEAHYYGVRRNWNEIEIGRWAPAPRAAAFIYLNKTCFNGLYRVNKAGHFNVPMGSYKNPPICVPAALRAAQRVLARAELRVGDYRACVHDARAGDLLYFDPPYDSTFASYTADSFNQDNQRELAQAARDLVARGCRVVLSNNDTPFVRALYEDFLVERVKCPRAINSDAAGRGDVDELIITGGFDRHRESTVMTATNTNITKPDSDISKILEDLVRPDVKRMLPVKLTDAELLEMAKKKAKKEDEITLAEKELDDESKRRKANINTLAKEVEQLGRCIRTEEEIRPVTTDEFFVDGTVVSIRRDTKAIVERRSPTLAEAQRHLPNGADGGILGAATQAQAAEGEAPDDDEGDGDDEEDDAPTAKKRNGKAKEGK